MRLRPATPLAIAFFIAFILLLISTLSTPIIKAIPLAIYGEFRFGVFGYCGPKNFCSSPTVRYNIDINGGGNDGDFTLAQPARHSLSSILIVHPIAAFLTLICTIMALSAHFHSPSHSAPFLLWLLILSFPTLLITLLAFLVDILLFVPHLAWGGWIVLGSTILISCCSVLTCAMRRTLVSRKARKKRIAEDDDMNGTNSESVYHATSQPRLVKETEGLATSDSQYTRAESPPPLDGATPANGSYRGGDKGPAFATYDMNRSQRPSTDDRVPLNPNRDPSIRTTSSHGRRGRPRDLQRGDSDRNGYGGDGRVSPVSPMEYDGAAGGHYGQYPDNRHRGASNRGRGGAPPYYSQSRGGYPPQRGSYGHRGGYPPRGGPGARGGYPPRGGMYPPRGGPNGMQGPPSGGWRDDINMGPIAVGAGAGAGGAMMGRGQRGPPSYDNEPYPPYSNQHQPQTAGHNDYGRGNPYDEPQQPAYRQPTPPSTMNPATAYPNTAALYGLNTNVPTPSQDPRGPSSRSGTPTSATNNADTIISSRGPASFGFSGRQPSPSRSRSQSRHREETAAANAPLPPLPTQPSNNAALPIGQAIEMDASSGSPAISPQSGDGNVISPIGAAIGDIQRGFGPNNNNNNAPSRTGTSHSHHNSQAVELPGHAITTHTASPAPSQQQRQESRHHRASSDAYYEDVPAAFAASSDPVANQHSPILTSPTHPPTVEQLQAQEAQRQRQQQQQEGGGNGMLPASLTPGAYLPPTGTAVRSGSRGANEAPGSSHTRPTLSSENSQSSFYNDGPGSGPAPMSSHHLGVVGPGAGVNRTTSPSAASESSSAYTSVSQRGVNPAYYEQYQSQGQGQGGGSGGYGYGQGQGQGYGYAQGVDRQRRPQQAVLDSNPDFGVGGGGGASNKGRLGRGGHVRGASGDGEGRYPAV